MGVKYNDWLKRIYNIIYIFKNDSIVIDIGYTKTLYYVLKISQLYISCRIEVPTRAYVYTFNVCIIIMSTTSKPKSY